MGGGSRSDEVKKKTIIGDKVLSKKNSILTDNAKKLRKNMTKEERHLWYDFFKTLNLTVNRQKVIGNYIVDFYIAQAKLVIEIDGSQHYTDENKYADVKRDNYMADLGLRVLRYSNLEINRNFESVCTDIFNAIYSS